MQAHPTDPMAIAQERTARELTWRSCSQPTPKNVARIRSLAIRVHVLEGAERRAHARIA